MSYSAVPDRRMPYDADGTVVGLGSTPAGGITSYPTNGQLINLNDYVDHGNIFTASAPICLWWFFPGEQREVTAAFIGYGGSTPVIEGSNNTTNGTDGTWETASCTPNAADLYGSIVVDGWRAHIFTISFTGPKAVVRISWSNIGGGENQANRTVHLYGEKAAGQTPDDIIFIDSDEGTTEFTTVEDFGDRPLGTTSVRQFKVKNTSATKTASGINLQCNDSDFAISTDNITYVVTISGLSLAPGASTATLYVKNTTPNPGATLGPRFARITASGYTFA